MTWEWVVLIVGCLVFVGWQSYIIVLKERTAIAARTLAELGVPTELEEMARESRVGTNGAS